MIGWIREQREMFPFTWRLYMWLMVWYISAIAGYIVGRLL